MTHVFLRSHRFRQNFASALPGVGVSLVVIALLKLGLWLPLEQFAYSLLFQLRGPIPWDQRIVVIAVDEPSLHVLGHFPWTRDRYAQLLNVLTRSESDLVVFNILFPEPSVDDPAFAVAMQAHSRVVLAKTWDLQQMPLEPNPTLRDAAIAVGHIAQSISQDGITRQVQPQVQRVPALSLAAIDVYQLTKQAVSLPDLNHPIWINWFGSASQVPTYSYQAVLAGQIPAETFNHKIVVVGVTAIGLDPLRTPFDRNPPTAGVYLHATAIANLLQHNSLTVPTQPWVMLGLLLIGATFSKMLSRLPRKPYLTGAITGLGWIFSAYLALHFGYWLPVASPLALLFGTVVAVAVKRYWHETQVLRSEIVRLWQTYHTDIITQQTYAPLKLIQSSRMLSPPVEQLADLAEQLGRSQSAQAAISRSVSVGLVATDLKGRVWFCNPVAMVQLPIQIGDLLVTQLVPAWLELAEWSEWVSSLDTQHGAKSRQIQHGDRWFELKLEPLLFVSQKHGVLKQGLQGLLLMIEDISDRRQTEAVLKQQMQALEELNRLKDDFLSTVSHELRTPMSNIKMAIHMMQLTMKSESTNRYLQILNDECDREINLINDLLDLQRLENGRRTLSLQEIYLQGWLPRFIEPFHERTESRQQQLQLHVESNLAPLTTDLAHLERILAELLNNACKYTPPGEQILLIVKPVADHVRFEIRNSGTEISESDQQQIFEKFYRVVSSDRWRQGGTGLGLALVKKLVEHLSGEIWVTSQTNETAFIVEIPIKYPGQL